jgi:diguanylate cyclase (GGDEF)-like protein/PAS domain S-box-containing protein
VHRLGGADSLYRRMAIIGDAILVCDEGKDILSCNAGAERMFGYAGADMLGRPVEALVGTWREGAYETLGRHKDGSNFPIRLTVHRTAWDGRWVWVGTAREAALAARRYEALLNEHSQLLATLEATADGILVVDLRGKILRYNERFRRMWNIPEEVLASRDDDQALAYVLAQLKDPQAFLTKVKELYAQPEAESFDVIEFTDGRLFERLSIPQRVDGRAVGRVWSFRDVTTLANEERRAKRRLSRLDALWRLVTQAELGHDDLVHRVLAEGCRALGCECGVLAHRDNGAVVIDYLAPAKPCFAADPAALAQRVLEAGGSLVLTGPDATRLSASCIIGTTLRMGDRLSALLFVAREPAALPAGDEDRAYVELLADYITRILLMREQDRQIAYLAYHDSLTGIPNRRQFQLRLAETIAAARRRGHRFGLIYVDLDRFKDVNDTIGHPGGDGILIEAVRRLQSVVRREDVVARLGGDEFAVLVTDIREPGELRELAARICRTLAEPFHTAHHDFYLTASAGIALFPTDGDTAELLFANADAAMYRAKEDGRDRFAFYSSAIASELHHRQAIREGVRRGLAHSEFVLEYQPVLNTRTRAVIGCEALVRWRHPERGRLLPDQFIPPIEDTNLVILLGTWVLRTAFRQLRAWAGRGIDLRLAVNLSARQFQDPGFVAAVREALAASGADPHRIDIEITESVALRDPAAAQATIADCKRLGLRCVLDDFGTHYSSLSYLKKLGADAIKIDRSFVDGLPADEESAAIVRAILALGRNLGRDVIAEGVETPEQARWLAREGCTLAQGYLYARPMEASDFEPWLDRQTNLSVSGAR